MYNKCSYPRFILHPQFLIRVLSSIRIFLSAFYPHFLIRVLSSIRIFLSAFYPPSAFSHPRFILHPHFLIRILPSAIRIRHPYPHPYPRFIPTPNFKRNPSGRTRIYEYTPPPINALVTPLSASGPAVISCWERTNYLFCNVSQQQV